MSFQQGLSGLSAAATSLDVIGNNVANANTVGFKSAQAQFADVYAASLAVGGGTDVGIGSRMSAAAPSFTQGNITATNNALDLAINGQGFFRMSDSGAAVYTRNGQFHLDKDGYIVNTDGARLTGYAANAAGVIVAAAPADLQLTTSDIQPQATAASRVVANLDSRASVPGAGPFNLADTSTYNSATSMSTFDSLGNAHTLSTYFVKTGANAWDVYAASDGVQIGAGALGALAFQPDGALDTAASTIPMNASVALANGAISPMTFTIDFTGTTQFGSTFGVTTLQQDGYASGRLSGFAIDDTGVITARYSNGQSRAQGQVALANFTSPWELKPLGSNSWTETSASGPALVGGPGTGNLGVLQSGAVEDSNVDLTKELVQMITAQRMYQANAQTIKTQDSVLQTLVNMR
jgi:flagellar hook protein FlgE